MADPGHHLRDLRAMRLIGRRREQKRDGRDQIIALERAEHDAFAPRRGGQRARPETFGVGLAQRMHEADRPAMGDGLDQDFAQRGERFGRGGQRADLKVGHPTS